jgi:hypothetical protein
MNAFPYTLNAEQYALFASLQGSALLPALATPGEGELVQLFKAAKKEDQRKTFEPYADILETYILTEVRSKLPSILEQLKQNPAYAMSAELFTWHTVQYHENLTDLAKRKSAMTPDERSAYYIDARARDIKIKNNRWETEVTVYETVYDYYTRDEEETYSMYPAKINKVFKVTDLAKRVALALGPCFSPYTRWEPVEEVGEEGPTGFSVFKCSLCVRYYPFGVDQTQLISLLEVAKAKAERAEADKIRELYPSERLDITAPPRAEDFYADMPSLISASQAQHQCFCGCAEDDDE